MFGLIFFLCSLISTALVALYISVGIKFINILKYKNELHWATVSRLYLLFQLEELGHLDSLNTAVVG